MAAQKAREAAGAPALNLIRSRLRETARAEMEATIAAAGETADATADEAVEGDTAPTAGVARTRSDTRTAKRGRGRT